MRRPGPKVSPPEWQPPVLETETLALEIQLITPMFGGGYEPRELDPDCPVRAAAVRGHLRFWWRATAGALCDSAEEVFAREERLWGSAQTAGSVTTRIRCLDQGSTQRCAEYLWDERRSRYPALPRFQPGWPSYALQPFQGKAEARQVVDEPAEARVNLRFELRVDAPAAETDAVRTAIAAWVQCGGIGARTRRGCGSLAWGSGALPISPPPGRHSADQIPVLAGSRRVLGPEHSDPIRAWTDAVNIYRDFRQKVGFARNPGDAPNRPGRSRWPEADTIRRLTGRHAASHSPSHPVHPAFPRADLGLPIIFHFKDLGDPGDTTLEGPRDGRRRFASPVITKAVQVAGRRYRPMVLILNAPHVWSAGDPELRLDQQSWRLTREQTEIPPKGRRRVAPLSGADVRQALLTYASAQWNAPVEEWP
jgi:CRISPR-associated protein Cmr1